MTAVYSMSATVTQVSPLQVQIDGNTSSCPAKALNASSFAVGNRVQVLVRNPRPPLVLGVES